MNLKKYFKIFDQGGGAKLTHLRTQGAQGLS